MTADDTPSEPRDVVLGGERPHARETALTRDADSHVRAFVLAMFPLSLVVMWPLVSSAERGVFFGALAWIVVTNAAGYLVPWHRLPRWTELLPPLTTIPALALLVAPAGGLSAGYGVVLIIPVLWLALYGDPPDIAAGLVVMAGSLLAPLETWFPVLPAQGSTRQVVFFLLLLGTIVIGVRPVIHPLRDQIRRTRRAVDALHASQAMLAHDLRNPLTAIRSLSMLASEQLEREGDETRLREKLAEYAAITEASADRAERIIEGVLELARAGEQLPWAAPIDLPTLVNEIAAGMPDVLVRTSRAPRTIVGHRPSIARLVANLLENAALHARAPEGQVTVTVAGRELAGGWVVTVADDGPGFAPGEPDALFEPWRRGDDVAAVGTGLGLAIVAGIVEQHGGTISAATGTHGGAEFTFTLARRPSVAGARDEDAPLEPEPAPA